MAALPDDFMRRYQAAQPDLRTLEGRRACYAEFERGLLPAKTYPSHPEHVSQRAEDLTKATIEELQRLEAHPELFPASVDHGKFVFAAAEKLKTQAKCIFEEGYAEQRAQDILSEAFREDLEDSRPTQEPGLAPWSQYLVPGAPAVRDAGYLSTAEDRDAQVMTPVAQSIVNRYHQDFRGQEALAGVNRSEDQDDENELEIEELDVALDDDFFSQLEVYRREEGDNRAMTLPEVNEMMSRIERQTLPANTAAAIAGNQWMLQHDAPSGEDDFSGMLLVRRRNRPAEEDEHQEQGN
ncbi:MAG: hypothetical protein Q9159_003330 [Coniocarpon cinnabarinum]